MSTPEETYFWKSMHRRNRVYLFDKAGGGTTVLLPSGLGWGTGWPLTGRER